MFAVALAAVAIGAPLIAYCRLRAGSGIYDWRESAPELDRDDQAKAHRRDSVEPASGRSLWDLAGGGPLVAGTRGSDED